MEEELFWNARRVVRHGANTGAIACPIVPQPLTTNIQRWQSLVNPQGGDEQA